MNCGQKVTKEESRGFADMKGTQPHELGSFPSSSVCKQMHMVHCVVKACLLTMQGLIMNELSYHTYPGGHFPFLLNILYFFFSRCKSFSSWETTYPYIRLTDRISGHLRCLSVAFAQFHC